MIVKTLLFIVVLFATEDARSAAKFEISNINNPVNLRIEFSDELTPRPVFENPPIFVEGDPGRFFVTTNYSWQCLWNPPIDSVMLDLGAKDCGIFSKPVTLSGKLGNSRDSSVAEIVPDWRRNYAGVMAALTLPAVQHRGAILLTIVHGENKNEKLGAQLFQNTIDPEISAKTCASGYTNGHYSDCWESYSGFIGTMSVPLRGTNPGILTDKHDDGPIIWPSMGYIDEGGRKASHGVRHPSAIIAGSYLYIYYVDTSRGSASGRQGGLCLVRIRLDTTQGLVAIPYFKGGFRLTEPSLPVDFQSYRELEFLPKKGGRVSPLWNDSTSTIKFSVAHLRGSARYLGIEEYVGANAHWGIRLRSSDDLIHWSDPVPVKGEDAQTWQEGNLHYPELVDSSLHSINEIDGSDFAIIGTGAGGKVSIIRNLRIIWLGNR
jgi:hypothetical protein